MKKQSGKNLRIKVPFDITSQPKFVTESSKQIRKSMIDKHNNNLVPMSTTNLEDVEEESKFKRKDRKLTTSNNATKTSLVSSVKSCFKLEQNENFREYMEDFLVNINRINNNSNQHLFCIFDGHGGKDSAKMCQELYPDILRKKIIANPFDHENNLLESFSIMNKELEKKNFNDIGNTATVVLIDKKALYCANVGDSSCALISSNKIEFISVDDDPFNKNEVNRIKKAGGKIVDGRLEDELAVTRSLGDFGLKGKGLIAEPHIIKKPIDKNSRYCILASDGIWGDVKLEDVLKICNELKEPEKIVNKIVEKALNLGSEDNISCIVVQLNL